MAEWKDSLSVLNRMADIERATLWVERFGNRASLPRDITSKLEVVLDEALSNVFTHGLAGSAPGTRVVELCLRVGRDHVELEVCDDGPEFDPIPAMAKQVGKRIADRRPGGAGLLFIKTLMDDVHFVRERARNRLILIKRLPNSGKET